MHFDFGKDIFQPLLALTNRRNQKQPKTGRLRTSLPIIPAPF